MYLQQRFFQQHDQKEMADCLYECLKEARLEKYYRNFVNGGLRHCEALLKLSMQDYPRYGIVLMEDRLRLFKLIQIVKSVQSEGLVCRHGHHVSKQQQSASVQSRQHQGHINKNHQQHPVHHGRPQPQIVQPQQISAAQRHQHQVINNPLAAPHHIARKSVTQVSYKPHSDSPIFHCRKTLKFTDSDLESSDNDDESSPSLPKQGKHELEPGANSQKGESYEQMQETKPEEPKINSQQNSIAVSQYLQNALSQGTTAIPITNVFHQKQDHNYYSMQHENEDCNKQINNNSSGSNARNSIGFATNEISSKKLIIDNSDGVLLINSKKSIDNSSETTAEENPVKVVKEPKVHVNKHFEKQAVNTNVPVLHVNNNFKDGAKQKQTVDSDSGNSNIGESPELNNDQNFELKNKRQSSEAFFIDTSAPTSSVNVQSGVNFMGHHHHHRHQSSINPDFVDTQSAIHSVQFQSIGLHQGNIMYRPLTTQEQQKQLIVGHTNHHHQQPQQLQEQYHNHQQQQPQPFHFKNFQPSTVITSGQHSYFPAHIMAQDFSHKKSHHKVEKVVHNTGYNYGVPTANVNSTEVQKQLEVQKQQETAACVSTTAGDVVFTSSSKPNSYNNNKTPINRKNVLGNGKIKVCVRKRPMLNKETKRGEVDVTKAQSSDTFVVEETKVTVSLAKLRQEHIFKFDEVFGASCNNEQVYSKTVKPLVQCVFNRGSATCFAFGQTGSGKSYTLLGNEAVPGLYQLAAADMFGYIEKLKSSSAGKFHLWASYYEIYCSYLFDLLNKRKRLHVRENNRQKVCIAGLMETEVQSVKGLVEVVQYGNAVRVTGVSGANSQSSRSHAILQLEVRDSKDVKLGRMSFIDLAGSERATDMTETSDRQTRIEGAEINQSLLALKECIRSLDQENKHTPYRQSKLTHILRDSFIGTNSQTVMIANVAPCMSSCVHTLNTLKYADRVKELRKNQEPYKNSPPKTNKIKVPTPKLQNVQHAKSLQTKTTSSATQIATQKTQPAFSMTRKISPRNDQKQDQQHSSYWQNDNNGQISTKKSPSSTQPQQQNFASNNPETQTPTKGTPALFMSGQNGMQFASTPKMKGTPPDIGQVASPFDVSRILREENDTPIRGHKIQRNDSKPEERGTPEVDDMFVGPTKLNFDSDNSHDEDDNEIADISKKLENNGHIHSSPDAEAKSPVYQKQTPGSEHSKSSSSQKSAKIYIGADKVNELIRMQRERLSVGQEDLAAKGIFHNNKDTEIGAIGGKIESTRTREESPETTRQRSKSSGRVLEANSQREFEHVERQRRSRSIERSTKYAEEKAIDHQNIKRHTTSNNSKAAIIEKSRSPVNYSSHSHSSKRISSSSRSRSGSSDRFSSGSYPIKSHDEIMAEHREVLDHLDSLLDRAKAAINESPIASARSEKPDVRSKVKDTPVVRKDNNGSDKTSQGTEKPLTSILKKTPQSAENTVHLHSKSAYLPSKIDLDSPEYLHSNQVRHSDPLVQRFPSNSHIQKGELQHISSEFKNELATNAQQFSNIHQQSNRIQPHSQFSHSGKPSLQQQYSDSEVVVEYEPNDGNNRMDSPRIPENKVAFPAGRNVFGPKVPSSERPRPEGEFQRSNSQTSDRESERSMSRNMSWHDILSQSNSEPKSKDSSFNDRHQRPSSKNSRDMSLEYFEEDKQGYSSRAMIKDLDTVVIETNIIPLETGRSTGDSGISTHRSHDIENELRSHSRESHSNDGRSSIESLGDVSSSIPTGYVGSNEDKSLLNTSIKVKYSRSKKATSRLSMLQHSDDSESCEVPPLKLSFEDDGDDINDVGNIIITRKAAASNGERNAYSARERVEDKHTDIDKIYSARDFSSNSGGSLFQNSEKNAGSNSGTLFQSSTDKPPILLPIHQDSAFTVLPDTNTNQQKGAIRSLKIASKTENDIEITQPKINSVSNSTSEKASNKVGAIEFSPIQSFPVTPRGGHVIAVPSVNKAVVNDGQSSSRTPPSHGLLNYLKSEKQSHLPSSKSHPNIPEAFAAATMATSMQGQSAHVFSKSVEKRSLTKSNSLNVLNNVPSSKFKTEYIQNHPSILGHHSQQIRNPVERSNTQVQTGNSLSNQSSTRKEEILNYQDTANTVKFVDHVPPNGAHGGGSNTPRIQHHHEAVAPTGSARVKSGTTEQKSLQQSQERLMMCHEEQLAQMTSLCKQEMKLLMSVRMSQQGFPEYVRALEEILSDKGRSILHLKSKIDEYVSTANK